MAKRCATNIISFELYPPKTTSGIKKLLFTCSKFQALQPEYFSVTFGAGGSAQVKTKGIVKHLCDLAVSVSPHLTAIGMRKSQVQALLAEYVTLGISRLVILRGDFPEQEKSTKGDFQYANELVGFIREATGNHFYIDVAAYPEFHPQALDVHTDLLNFKRKILAGANGAITQYFFNKEAYFRFMDCCQQYGIDVPVVPGIMPIRNFANLMRFSKICQADVPLWLYKRLQQFGHDEASLRLFGIDVVTKLCEDLLAGGAPGLHFYTLNQLEPTQTIIKNLNLQYTKNQLAAHYA